MTALAITQIRTDGGTQPRALLDPALISEYAEAMQGGAEFPPVVVFHDGTDHWLADGFHRLQAVKQNGKTKLDADIRQGSQRDAILFSVGTNVSHGKRRTNDDKRRAVMKLLNDEKWAQWPQVKIAKACCVSAEYVSRLKHREGSTIDRSIVQASDGRMMNTSNIGEAPRKKRQHYEQKISPKALPPKLGHSKPHPKITLDLPRDNPDAVAGALLSAFGEEFVKEIMDSVRTRLKGLK